MGIIAWIVIGAIAGVIANLIMGTHEGVIMTIVLGIVGAVVGGFLAGAFLNLKDPMGINLETIVVSVVGAVIVVFVVRMVMGSSSGNARSDMQRRLRGLRRRRSLTAVAVALATAGVSGCPTHGTPPTCWFGGLCLPIHIGTASSSSGRSCSTTWDVPRCCSAGRLILVWQRRRPRPDDAGPDISVTSTGAPPSNEENKPMATQTKPRTATANGSRRAALSPEPRRATTSGTEVQRFGSLRQLPIGLSAAARKESCQLLNPILADSHDPVRAVQEASLAGGRSHLLPASPALRQARRLSSWRSSTCWPSGCRAWAASPLATRAMRPS